MKAKGHAGGFYGVPTEGAFHTEPDLKILKKMMELAEMVLRSAEQGKFATEGTLRALWFGEGEVTSHFDCPRVYEGRVMTAALKN